MSTEPDTKKSPKGAKIAVGIFIGLIVIGLIVAGFALFGNVWAPVQEKSESETYTDPITRLDIEGKSGDIEIVATDGDEVVVDRVLRWSGDRKPRSVEKWTGDILRIRVEGCEGFRMGFSRCAIYYRIQVPADIEAIAMADSGNVTTDGVLGAQKLSADSGDVTVNDAGSDLDINVDSGVVDVTNVVGNVTVEADSGDVRMTGVEGTEFAGNVDSGNLDVTFATAPESVTATVDSGDVTIMVPEGEETYKIKGDTDSGTRTVNIVDDPGSERVMTITVDSGDLTIDTR
ncbi:DUF4097 family beta strand repeat-containing protein [Stackebrandtia soli]|uniref:DUF4097 family beta strand repeat-containing protein n=1 Tax=Stackebrandtia soli TaxID=1892856 RepID=UPI0039EB35A6